MSGNGWIKLHRNIMDNWVYEDAEYLKIWITFLLEATHKPYKKLIGNNIEFLERGQFVFGRKKYSQRLNIKEWKIQKATELFVQDEMIKVIKRTNKYTIYEVVNYSLYQQQNQQEETSEISGLEQSKQQQHRQQNNSKTSTEQQQSNTLQEYKNNKNDKNNTVCMYSENLKEIVSLLEQNIGIIPPVLIDEINEYSNIFSVEMFREAIKIAANRKKRHVNYVLGVLRQWKDNNIITIDDLEAFRREKEMERREKQQNQNKQYTPKKNRFHNFEQRTDKYSAEQLEEIARRKREEYYKKLQGGI